MKKNILLICLSIFFLKLTAQEKNKAAYPLPFHSPPECEFSVLNFCYGDTAYFINQTLYMMNLNWQISDSSGIIFSSADTNIKFLFPAMGTYTVMLSANNGHPDSIIKIMNVDTTVSAAFDFQQCTQRFVNMSACAQNFYWDFGNGNFSSSPIPIHMYPDTGNYAVTLVASNGIAADTLTQTIHVESKGFPSSSIMIVQSNDTFYFFTDSIADYFTWDFGDQTTSNLQNPWHVYSDTGDFFISLLSSNFCGIAWNSTMIHVSPAGISSLNAIDLSVFVYPNPSSGKIQVTSTKYQVSRLEVYNLLGEKIYFTDYQILQSPIDLSQKPDGLYFLKIKTDKGIISKKMVLMH